MKKVFATVFIFAFLCSNAAAGGKSSLEIYGDYMNVVIPLSAAVYSAVIGDWQGELQLAQSYAATIATTSILKSTVNAERPSGGNRSFPSGHASSAFAGSAYWQMRYGWVFGAPMYAAATVVAYSRVYSEAHYWRDVAASAVIGIGFNYLFASQYGNDDKSEWRMSFVPTPKGVNFNFSIRF